MAGEGALRWYTASGGGFGVHLPVSVLTLPLVSCHFGRYALTTVLSSTSFDPGFSVMNIYTSSDHAFTQDFVDEMVALSDTISGPWLVLHDFNLIRYPRRKTMTSFARLLRRDFTL